jgi:hypothetical protein
MSGQEEAKCVSPLHSFAVVSARNAGHIGGLVRANRYIHYNRPACAARVRAAARPRRGLYLDTWTPGYWGWGGNRHVFYDGYWGPRVGFYGGINYGYGYFGHGYQGGRWNRGRFFYNRSVNNVNVTNIHNVYNPTVINKTTVNRVSYNGGRTRGRRKVS